MLFRRGTNSWRGIYRAGSTDAAAVDESTALEDLTYRNISATYDKQQIGHAAKS
jgi:hypothetical protein